MKVNYLNNVKVCFAQLKNSNISTKTFNRILNKVSGLENLPASFERALIKKAVNHANLKIHLELAYQHRDDKTYVAKIATQKELLKNNNMTPADYIKIAHNLSKEVFEASGMTFRSTVKANLQPNNMDHTSTNKTSVQLTFAQKKLKEAEKSLGKLNEKIQQETRTLPPEEENIRASYIKEWYKEDLGKIKDEIEKNTNKITNLNNELLKQRKIFIETVIIQAEKKPEFTNDIMQSYLTELREMSKYYQELPGIRMRAESKIDKLTKQWDENKVESIQHLVLR